MDTEVLNISIGPELDASLARLEGFFDKSREEIIALLLEEASFVVEDMYERSGQAWDSVRFEYVHGGRRSRKRVDAEAAIERVLKRAREMSQE